MRATLALCAVALCVAGALVASPPQRDAAAAAVRVSSVGVADTPRVAAPAATIAIERRDGSADASPSPAVYGRNGREIDLHGVGVAAYLEGRMRAARMGDATAVYEVYQALSICAANDDPVADYARPEQREAFLRERARLQALCAGVSPAQVQERLQFLATAAANGNAAAQIDYYMEGPLGHPFDPSQVETDPQVQQWRDDALAFLGSAAGHCDPFALGLLSTVYDAGELTARDTKRSMVYRAAELAARKLTAGDERLQRRFGAELSSDEFQAAQQEGLQLASSSCAP